MDRSPTAHGERVRQHGTFACGSCRTRSAAIERSPTGEGERVPGQERHDERLVARTILGDICSGVGSRLRRKTK